MIKTKEELKKYINEDLLANGLESKRCSRLRFFLINYRKLEYHTNKKHKIRASFFRLIDKILQDKMKTFIPINVFGYGLKILHPFVIVVNQKSRVGNYCTLHHMVTIGNNKKEHNVAPVIGNNCIIGAGAVVAKSFGDNKTLIGVPAKEK